VSSQAAEIRNGSSWRGHGAAYNFPPGLERNLVWFAFRKFKPQNPIELFQFLVRRYGNIAHYRIGPANIVFVNEPEYIYEVFVAQQDKFIKERTQQRSKMVLGEGMITAEGAEHRRQRAAALPAFHKQRIAGYAATMVERAAAYREQWRHGETIDVSQEMMRLTLDVVARTLFSADLGRDVGRATEALNEIMRLYHALVALPGIEALVNLPVPGLRRFRPAKKRLDEVVGRLIDERRATPEGHDDLLAMMLESQVPFDREALRDQVLTIFLAGYETVANGLTWTFYLLSQNPDAEAKLHAEVDSVLGGRLPAPEDVARLSYTEMVLAESMRLYPPAWAMGRVATQDFALGPYHLPRKTTILASQYILHRDARFFAEPLAFRPERFAAEGKAAIPRFAYLPFGLGLRRCIGEGFAWMESILVLATVAQRWKLRMDPAQVVEPQPLITLRTRYGMKMRMERRPGE